MNDQQYQTRLYACECESTQILKILRDGIEISRRLSEDIEDPKTKEMVQDFVDLMAIRLKRFSNTLEQMIDKSDSEKPWTDVVLESVHGI